MIEAEEMFLPPGFRFHPTDEELITHYLAPKVAGTSFCATVIGELDLNKREPWDLPCEFLHLSSALPASCDLTNHVWSCSEHKGRGRVVLLLHEGQEVPNWLEDKQSHRFRPLESNRKR